MTQRVMIEELNRFVEALASEDMSPRERLYILNKYNQAISSSNLYSGYVRNELIQRERRKNPVEVKLLSDEKFALLKEANNKVGSFITGTKEFIQKSIENFSELFTLQTTPSLAFSRGENSSEEYDVNDLCIDFDKNYSVLMITAQQPVQLVVKVNGQAVDCDPGCPQEEDEGYVYYYSSVHDGDEIDVYLKDDK